MGQVAVVLKIMPEAMEKFEELKEAVVKQMKPYKLEEQPVAFGIVALIATFVVEDGAGGSDILEQKAAALPNVGSAEVSSVDRL